MEIFVGAPTEPVLDMLRMSQDPDADPAWSDRLTHVTKAIRDRVQRLYEDAGRGLPESPTEEVVLQRLLRLYRVPRIHDNAPEIAEWKQRVYFATLNSMRPEFYEHPDEQKLWARAVSGEVSGDERFALFVELNLFRIGLVPLRGPHPHRH